MDDERAHPGTTDGWWFDLTVGDLVCAVQLVSGELWRYRACLLRGDDLVVVLDDDVPPPRPGTVELRTHGLWVEHYVEVPFDHVSVGCEAFALDLGWETSGEVVPRTREQGYEIDCVVYGEILVDDERIAVDAAPGRRGHVWGDVPADAWLTSTPLPTALGGT